MVSQPDTRSMQRDEPELGAGRRLADARRAAGLGPEEVAGRLRLDMRTIRLIEQDDYSQLPAPMFVRGYLRNYARLLDLPPGPIVEAFDRFGFDPPTLRSDITNAAQAQSTDFPVRIVTYLIVLCLAALVIVWWRNHQIDPAPSPAAVGSASPADATDAMDVTDTTDVAGGAGETLAAAERPAGAPGAAPGIASGIAASPPPPAAADRLPAPGDGPPAAVDEPATREPGSGGIVSDPPAPDAPLADPSAPDAPLADPSAPDAPLADPSVPDAPVPDAGTASATVTARRSPAGEDAPGADSTTAAGLAAGAQAPPAATGEVLEIRFAHESWVEIYDRAGARLYYDLIAAGETLEVTGEAPFRVLLGYARDAEIEYNGAPFDHTPFVRREIARFTVGGAATGASGDASAQTSSGADVEPAPEQPSPESQAPSESSTNPVDW